jgi:predicted PurR-regulated permease PerM
VDSNLFFKNKNQLFLTLILGSMFITASLLVYFVFKPYFWSGLIAGIFYVATRKIHKILYDLLSPKFRWASPWIMVLILLTLVVLPSIFIASNLIRETVNLIQYIRLSFSEDKIISTVIRFSTLTDFVTDNEFFWLKIPFVYREFVGKYVDVLNLDSIYGILRNSSTTLLGSLDLPTGFIFNAFFAFLLLFFFYKEGKNIEKWIFKSLPFPKDLEDKIGRRIEAAVQTVVMGNLLISLIQGAVLYILVLICGFSNPFLYAIIGTFFSLIPVIGTAVVWLPLSLYLGFIESSWILAIFLMASSFSAYLILENLVKPKLLDKKLKIHPFLIFLSLIGGIKEFGLIGVVIGPVALTIIIILWDFWKLFKENALSFQGNQNG